MDNPRFVLTTIGKGIVAILETPAKDKTMRGEYLLSFACVEKNLASGQFVDVTDKVEGTGGKVYALAADLLG